MNAAFSTTWNSSVKPNKQRKYRFKAPMHIRANLLHVHLSKELRQKYSTRAIRVRVGDKVRLLIGQYKKQEGKVEEVNMKLLKVFVAKIEHTKKDGTKSRYPIDPSNLVIVELNTDDKKRFKFQDRKKALTVEKKPKTVITPLVKSTTSAKATKTVAKSSEKKTTDKKSKISKK